MYLADLVQIGLEFVEGELTSRERQLAKEQRSRTARAMARST